MPSIPAGGAPAAQGSPTAQGSPISKGLVPLVTSLFFAWGFCTVLVDTLVPKLKAMFELNYAEAMLAQFAYFIAYFIFSIPAGLILSRLGYMKTVTLALMIMAAGAFLFAPAAHYGAYLGFLAALFIIAAGVTILQVAANPLMAVMGDEAGSSARLTLAQAFNSLATTVGPWFGAYFILSHGLATPPPGANPQMLEVYRQVEGAVLSPPFMIIAVALVCLAVAAWMSRNQGPAVEPVQLGGFGRLITKKRVALGVVAIFTYVGAEVSIGSSIVNYLMLPSTLAAKAEVAGFLVSLYWGGAMVGRFIGAAVLRIAPAPLVLAICAAGAAVLVAASGLSSGLFAAVTVLAIGLFNAIMFPTIFALSVEGHGEDTPTVSGLLCLAIVGGAVVPVITGAVADKIGLGHAFFVPVLCYLWIIFFGLTTWREIRQIEAK